MHGMSNSEEALWQGIYALGMKVLAGEFWIYVGRFAVALVLTRSECVFALLHPPEMAGCDRFTWWEKSEKNEKNVDLNYEVGSKIMYLPRRMTLVFPKRSVPEQSKSIRSQLNNFLP